MAADPSIGAAVAADPKRPRPAGAVVPIENFGAGALVPKTLPAAAGAAPNIGAAVAADPKRPLPAGAGALVPKTLPAAAAGAAPNIGAAVAADPKRPLPAGAGALVPKTLPAAAAGAAVAADPKRPLPAGIAVPSGLCSVSNVAPSSPTRGTQCPLDPTDPGQRTRIQSLRTSTAVTSWPTLTCDAPTLSS